ncbi:hypothetical protein OMP43_18735 [Sphingomonas sp. CBMAI 2297]|uniref:hypothetical protein n=1 Tax=Sphingomonas sp. CBMAI 2297 TaxID=2991720 RepID=UPI0024559D3D|nr:hypothetical protein [Sphingomonas sp. CBMAI 2297]MDH4746068.1 hypothetical protein [Sphingomonas sp. CBMAI 2297]
MRALTGFGRDLRRLAALLLLAVALAGCAHVQLAAPYDAATDAELGSVLQDTTSFVAKMATNAGQPAGAYAQNTDFYDNMEGRVALLVARAQANRVLDNCPSTQAMARALAAADLPPAIGGKIGTPPQGDCDVVLMQLLQQQFHDLRAFHQAEGGLGIPAAAVGPLLDGGLGATLRAAMAVQRAKQLSR